MKTPVRCFECRDQYMELDLGADHQHLECSNCHTVWCTICIMRDGVLISAGWKARMEEIELWRRGQEMDEVAVWRHRQEVAYQN